MPVNSIRFKQVLANLVTWLTLVGSAQAQLPELDGMELRWLGKQIYANECNSRPACLTSWNSGEDFPSLGIGHFIWYRSGQQEAFEETFPALLEFLADQGITLPAWLARGESPWHSREQFLAATDSPAMRELRQLLADTADLQARFIVQRLHDSAPALLQSFDPAYQAEASALLHGLIQADPPLGLYALIDYQHFKGSGLHGGERYAGQGWGLRDVLLAMAGQEATLANFVAAAEEVLERRVRNAPVERNEQRWLQGWRNRLQTYLP